MKNNFLKISLLLATFFALTSCDKDFNSLGSDLVDDTHFNLEKYDASVIAYSKATGPVQTNNLPVNALGIYKNPVFGTTKAHFVTQLQLANPNPTIGTNITIDPVKDSVYLYIPYFSHLDSDTTVADTYILDSISGNVNSTMNLKIYRNGYTLRNFSPNPDPLDGSYNQKYYSDDKDLVENVSTDQLNDNANSEENTAFKFKKENYIKYKTNENGEWLDANGVVTTDTEKRVVLKKFTPGMWINLNKQYIKNNILEAPSSALLNNNNFKEYFKGLYFQINENSGEDGALAMLDFSKGKVYIQYHSDITTTNDSGTVTVNSKKELVLNLSGNTVNFYDYENDANYQSYLNASNAVTGDEKLYLKGGEGSVVFLDLFGKDDIEKVVKLSDGTYEIQSGANGIPDELDNLRLKGWLINNANLTFYIENSNQGMNASSQRPKEPRRIYLYDATNNRALVDYSFDGTTAPNSKNNKYDFGGIMKFDNIDNQTNEPGILYKINITSYINNIVNNQDKTIKNNYKLGLSVTENILATNSVLLKTPLPVSNPVGSTPLQVKFVPTASAMNPLGTILHGPLSTATYTDDNGNEIPMKLKLEIFFTKPN